MNSVDTVLHGSIEWYSNNYSSCTLCLDPHKAQILDNTCLKIIDNKLKYQNVARATNVPWYLIAALHSRESDLNFNTYLGNGDVLSRRTTHVPAGRGPFNTWDAGAVDALELDGLSGRNNWTLPLALMMAEKFNGTGYLKYHPSVLSPYLWSFTSLYTVGKYGSDGHFNPHLVDQQVGVAAIFKELQSRGVLT